MRLSTTFFLAFLGISTVFAQENCPSFKIKRNKGVQFNSFTTALKFQLDGWYRIDILLPFLAHFF